MPVQQKNRAATELRAKADQILAELADPTKEFTKDEVEKRAAEASALISRSQAVAGFTPQDEIEDQGGDANLRGTRTPDGEPDERKTYKQEVEALAKRVEQAFGGPNSLILALARQSIEPLTTRQQDVMRSIRDLQARTITAESGNASKAEVLLPLTQVESIFRVPMEVGGMASIATRYNVPGRTLRIPYLVQSSTDVNRPMSGIANVTIVGEAAPKPLREPKFEQRLLTVYKYAAYTEFGDETLADDMTGDLAPVVQQAIGGAALNKINEDVTFDGTGSSMPLGAFHPSNPALYKVIRSNAGAFTATDAFEMYARHVLGPNSRWFIHPSVLPQLMAMTLNGTTLVTFINSLQGVPTMQLLGIPIVVTPLVALLGLEGDVCLGNGAFYAMALRQALTIESSIHYKFRDDITAYRFYARAGGIPIPDGLYSYKVGSNSAREYAVSPFVVLDDVYAS